MTRLDLDLLARLAERPELYAGSEPVFWSDPYVSEHVLHAHLDPETDDASRRPECVDQTVEFVLRKLRELRPDASGRHHPTVLDLGCGPGIYAERLAEAGCIVTGIDISPASIEYARTRADERGLSIRYVRGDFRSPGLGGFATGTEDERSDDDSFGGYDAVLQVYGEFCTLSESERVRLLSDILKVLRPGGLLMFDVFTESYVRRIRTCGDWYVSVEDGFWRPDTHAVFEQIFHYPADSASVVRYTIVDETGTARQFSVWWRHFSRAEIVSLVEFAGFVVDDVCGVPWGTAVENDSEWISLVCRRPDL